MFRTINRILLVQVAGIGDLVMATPAIRAIRRGFSEAHIALLADPSSVGIIEGSPDIDELFLLSRKFLSGKSLLYPSVLSNIIKKATVLRAKRFDMVINLCNISTLSGAIKMAILFYLIGAKCRVGRNTDGRGFFFNLKISERLIERTHEVERNLRVAKALECDVSRKDMSIPLSERDREFVDGLFAQQQVFENKIVIGLDPGAARPTRRWMPERFAQVADKLAEKENARIIITVGKGEEWIAQDIASLMHTTPIVLPGNLSLKQLAAIISKLTLFITNDTGPMHIASALNIPLIVLFGPGDPGRVGPYGNPETQVVLKKDTPCSPCYRYECKNMVCLKSISVGEVLEAAHRLLAKVGKELS